MSKVLMVGSGAKNDEGREILLAPHPIRSEAYIHAIVPGRLGDVKEAAQKTELLRAARIYERFKAYLQPLKKIEGGGTLWEVRFPEGSPYKNGPKEPHSFDALIKNYVRNKEFPGHDLTGRPIGIDLMKTDEVVTQAVVNERRRDGSQA